MAMTFITRFLAPALLLAALGGSASAQLGPVPAPVPEPVTVFNGLNVKVERVIPGVGEVLIPESSFLKVEDIGRRARTHYRILKPVPLAANPAKTITETPASLACVYRVASMRNGCDPTKVTRLATGGSKLIAIVDAYHNAKAKHDLIKFSREFGLPDPKIEIVYCSASTCGGAAAAPPADRGWAGEIALDIQWAHAMAPDAKILLVEARSNAYDHLLLAVDYAANRVQAAGGGQVSMSWGGSEFSGQTSLDSHFVKSGVVFFASTGDHQNGTNQPDINWPSTSPNVIAVGGTTVQRKSDNTFNFEEAWEDGGGGVSGVYRRPAFQDSVESQTRNHRGVPDIAWNADPASGVPVYCSKGICASSGGFFVFGGTSLAAPAVAAMTNAAGKFRTSSDKQHKFMYDRIGGAHYIDVVAGRCGNGTGGRFASAKTGWDRCTGIGTPKGDGGL
jgi:subtilase family serine protease